MVATLHGLPVAFALTGAKADERQILLDLLGEDPALLRPRWSGPDRGQELQRTRLRGDPVRCWAEPAAPDPQSETPRPGSEFFKPLRQSIESIFDTCKGQLDLEHHGGHTPTGVLIRILQRILALTAAIWHNDHTGQPIKRSLVAYDH